MAPVTMTSIRMRLPPNGKAALDSEDPVAAAAEAAANELTEHHGASSGPPWSTTAAATLVGSKTGGERVLSQEEIDNLLGFSVGEVNLDENSGIRAIIDSAMVSYERLPMLEIVFDRLVRLMTTSLRNFTSDNVEVSLDRITSVRFGDYHEFDSAASRAVACSRPRSGRTSASLTVDSSLIYSIIDVLLGGRRGQASLRIEGRPYTTIETNLVKRLVEVVLADAEQAFRPLSPVTFTHRPAGDQSALCRHQPSRQRRHSGAPAHRHGRPRRQYRVAAALRDHRTDPRRAVADVHGRKVRPRSDLGRPSAPPRSRRPRSPSMPCSMKPTFR